VDPKTKEPSTKRAAPLTPSRTAKASRASVTKRKWVFLSSRLTVTPVLLRGSEVHIHCCLFPGVGLVPIISPAGAGPTPTFGSEPVHRNRRPPNFRIEKSLALPTGTFPSNSVLRGLRDKPIAATKMEFSSAIAGRRRPHSEARSFREERQKTNPPPGYNNRRALFFPRSLTSIRCCCHWPTRKFPPSAGAQSPLRGRFFIPQFSRDRRYRVFPRREKAPSPRLSPQGISFLK